MHENVIGLQAANGSLLFASKKMKVFSLCGRRKTGCGCVLCTGGSVSRKFVVLDALIGLVCFHHSVPVPRIVGVVVVVVVLYCSMLVSGCVFAVS